MVLSKNIKFNNSQGNIMRVFKIYTDVKGIFYDFVMN